MWYLERPSLFGPSPVLSLTFVAMTTASLWSSRSSPTISSDLPAEYTLAVSKKFTPRSRARFIIRLALSISIIHSSELPKDIVPRQMRDTCNPVDPSRLYSIEPRGTFQGSAPFKSSMDNPFDCRIPKGFGLPSLFEVCLIEPELFFLES